MKYGFKNFITTSWEVFQKVFIVVWGTIREKMRSCTFGFVGWLHKNYFCTQIFLWVFISLWVCPYKVNDPVNFKPADWAE